jgi:hypothetical protein
MFKSSPYVRVTFSWSNSNPIAERNSHGIEAQRSYASEVFLGDVTLSM